MITITFAIGAFLGLSILGYFTYDYRNKAQIFQAKFESTKDFANEAASRILELENSKKELAVRIHELEKEKLIIVEKLSNQPTTKPVKAKKTNKK